MFWLSIDQNPHTKCQWSRGNEARFRPTANAASSTDGKWLRQGAGVHRQIHDGLLSRLQIQRGNEAVNASHTVGPRSGGREVKHDGMTGGVLALDLETDLRQVGLQHNRLASREMVVFEHQMQVAVVEHRMEPLAHAVERNDFNSIQRIGPVAAVAEPAEDWIVRQNRRRHAHRAAEAEILLG